MESEKILTITFITIVCLAVILGLTVLFFCKIMERLGKSEGNAMVNAKKMRQVVVEKPLLQESLKLEKEIYAPLTREKEPPPRVSVGEACVMPKELTLREKIEVVDKEYAIEKEKIKEDCRKIDQDLHQAFTDLTDVMVECVRFNNRERMNSSSSQDSGNFNK